MINKHPLIIKLTLMEFKQLVIRKVQKRCEQKYYQTGGLSQAEVKCLTMAEDLEKKLGWNKLALASFLLTLNIVISKSMLI